MSKTTDSATLAAIVRGKERSANYQHPDPQGIEITGTVAVIKRGDKFLVGWHELRADTSGFDEPDAEGLVEFDTVDAAEKFLVTKFGLRLSDLKPSRGCRFF